MTAAVRGRARLTGWTDEHPAVALPLKASFAATAAWLLVQPVGGFLTDYQYYAPLGAVFAMSPTVATSARSGVDGVLAILVGGGIAVAVHSLPLPQPASIAAAVGAGLACSRWNRLGDMGSWVPFVALFALILGGRDPWHYVAAYALLAGFGALVGLVVNFIFPQVPTGPVHRAERRTADRLADALRFLADAIGSPSSGLSDKPPALEGWLALRDDLNQRVAELHRTLSRVADARRWSWRSRQAEMAKEELEPRARQLRRVADCTADIGDALARRTRGGSQRPRPGDSRRSLAADLAAAASAVEARYGGPESGGGPTHAQSDDWIDPIDDLAGSEIEDPYVDQQIIDSAVVSLRSFVDSTPPGGSRTG